MFVRLILIRQLLILFQTFNVFPNIYTIFAPEYNDINRMTTLLKLSALLARVILAVVAAACGNTSTTKTEKVEGNEWNVTVCKAVPFDDAMTGVNTESTYTVADTATINRKLLGLKPENLTFEWTIPGTDEKIWLVAYYDKTIFSDKVVVTEVNCMPSYDGNIQVVFKFSDSKKWEIITRENIGKRLAVFVNGQLMNAPQVNTAITSGKSSVLIPTDMVHDYLPHLDLEKLKQ